MNHMGVDSLNQAHPSSSHGERGSTWPLRCARNGGQTKLTQSRRWAGVEQSEEQEPPKKRPHDRQMYIVEVGAVLVTVWIKGQNKMLESKLLTKGHYFGVRCRAYVGRKQNAIR